MEMLTTEHLGKYGDGLSRMRGRDMSQPFDQAITVIGREACLKQRQ